MSGAWTIDSVRDLLDRNDMAVERALVAIYRRQTEEEKRADATRNLNGVGFASVHARSGGYMARWVLDGRKLDGRFLDRGRKIAKRYARQLVEIANERGM